MIHIIISTSLHTTGYDVYSSVIINYELVINNY